MGDMRSDLAGQQRQHEEFIGAQARREEHMTEWVDRQSHTEHSLQGAEGGGKDKYLSSLVLPYIPWQCVSGQGYRKGQARSTDF